MTVEKLNGNGKGWRVATFIGVPTAGLLAVFITWIWAGGVAGGALVNRVSQAERRIDRQDRIYEQMAGDITDIKIMLARMQKGIK